MYHGLRSKGWKKYYWLDLWKLAEHFLLEGQFLRELWYCTSRVRRDPEGLARQLLYIDALTLYRQNMKVLYGNYLVKKVWCPECQFPRIRHEEKMTDVNIACQLLADAMDDRFDTALVISGDSDLAPPIEMIKERFPEKRIIVLFPPNRVSKVVRRISTGYFSINESDVKKSMLPDIVGSEQKLIIKPSYWV